MIQHVRYLPEPDLISVLLATINQTQSTKNLTSDWMTSKACVLSLLNP